jgi:hypothetical protein
VISNKTINLAGGKAFSHNPETELTFAVLTTFLEDKYYESGDERIERIKNLIPQCDSLFVSKLALVTRKEFHLRSVPIILLGELAKNRSIKHQFITETIERVDDMTELVSYLDGKLPKQVKRGLRHALLKFNRYQLGKYRGEGKKVKLVDIFNLVHPNPEFANDEQKLAWKDLMTGKLKSVDTWESVISTSKNKKEDWKRLIVEGKLGYMALIRNLNNFLKNDLDRETLQCAVEQLTNKEKILKSKQLPFRFWTAYQNVKGSKLLSTAIAQAMDIALLNLPSLKGKTLIAVDMSGSMQSGAIEKAAPFASALFKASDDVEVIMYDTSIKRITLNGISPCVDIVEKILQNVDGGGTQTSLVFQYATKTGTKYDRIIILSDNESWTENLWGGSVQSSYIEYKKATESDPFVYAIDIQGYGTKDITGQKVVNLSGWSDRLLSFINEYEKGNSIIDYIREYNIETHLPKSNG